MIRNIEEMKKAIKRWQKDTDEFIESLSNPVDPSNEGLSTEQIYGLLQREKAVKDIWVMLLRELGNRSIGRTSDC